MPENARGYRHFTFDERCEIQRLLNSGESVSPIARSLGRSVSSVTREIKRNRRDDGYRSTPTGIVRLCVHYRTCEIKALCRLCSTRRCASWEGALHQHLPALRRRRVPAKRRGPVRVQRMCLDQRVPAALLPLRRQARTASRRLASDRFAVGHRHHLGGLRGHDRDGAPSDQGQRAVDRAHLGGAPR